MVKRVIYNKKKYLGLENQLWYLGGEGRWSTEPGIGGGGRRGGGGGGGGGGRLHNTSNLHEDQWKTHNITYS